MAPGAYQRRQTGKRARRLTTAGRALDGNAHADGGGLRCSEFACQSADVFGVDAGDPGDSLGRVFRGACL